MPQFKILGVQKLQKGRVEGTVRVVPAGITVCSRDATCGSAAVSAAFGLSVFRCDLSAILLPFSVSSARLHPLKSPLLVTSGYSS